MASGRVLMCLATLLSLFARAAVAEAEPGATLPWTTYEAESARTTGTVLGPDFAGRTPAHEASGRSCVSLRQVGQSLEFSAKADAQGLVVRYCVPDSADGQGIDATLSLYLNGQFKAKLPVTSRYAYLYGKYPFTNRPAAGAPRHFWDELRCLPGVIHRGDTVRLQRDADDTAADYLIDFVDLEAVPPAIAKPDDALSVCNFGAVADGRSDARPAFLKTIAEARAGHKTVWVPPGAFALGGPLALDHVAVRGAGMWYSTLVGVDDYAPGRRVSIEGAGSDVTLSDLAIVGKLNYRNDQEANDGLGGSFGTGSRIRNVWVEHTKTGAWLTNSDGLVVEGCRFRDTIADGINVCVGMRNTLVRDCSARGNGDDCFAIWPATYAKAVYTPGFNRIVNCTAQLPFLAQGFSIYGGEANRVENCEAVDICYGAGLFASTTFPTDVGFGGETTFANDRVVRCGDADGAIGIFANRVALTGLRVVDTDVIDSLADGIKFTSVHGQRAQDVVFRSVRVTNTGLGGAGYGVAVGGGAAGEAKMSGVHVVNAKTAAVQTPPIGFQLIQKDDSPGVADDSPTARGDPR